MKNRHRLEEITQQLYAEKDLELDCGIEKNTLNIPGIQIRTVVMALYKYQCPHCCFVFTLRQAQ